MPDRLKELQRQRALMQEHLGWLDREIAAEAGTPVSSPAPAASTSFADPAHAEAVAEQILSQYQNEPQSLQSKVKRGCFLYLLFAFALVGLGVLVLYIYSTRK